MREQEPPTGAPFETLASRAPQGEGEETKMQSTSAKAAQHADEVASERVG
jgi:hypothetical protein